ncbi:MAG TPA: sulfatase-like hydrolase/transferase [Vicinamibacterales bacterium]|nr:sulfatase-like hydrolase/transferase [Vicinamibacterales bacterium]
MILALVAGGWLWWRRAATPAMVSGACRGCNVLLITIDTLRVDRVGAFGGRPGLTPRLDQLASAGLRLTRTYSAAPLTLPSHASILTAVSPPVHGLRANGLFRLGPNLPTLATVLKAQGYRTGAFVGAFVLDARFGLNRGFDVYDDRYGEKPSDDPAEGAERRAEDVIKPAANWIIQGSGLRAQGSQTAQAEPSALSPQPSSGQPSALSPQPSSGAKPSAPSPWFAWVHLYDPHEPYRAPEPYASQHEPYDAEVAYTDAMVGRLLDELQAAGRLERTLVIVAADHGESLGEHGERTHGVFVYDATMRVPWIISQGSEFRVQGSGSGFGVQGSGSGFGVQGSGSGAAFDGLVRLIDLSPSVLDLVGVAAPAEFEGRSVVPAVNSAATVLLNPDTPDKTAYLEAMDANLTRNWAPLTAVATHDYKLIDLPNAELYDLKADPKETTNLFSRDAERARTLESLLRGMATSFQARGSSGEKTALSADARQRLQALGYVASSADPGTRVYTAADDPKTLISASNDLDRAVKAFNAGSRAEAMSAVRTIIREHPSFSTAQGQLASMQRQSGDLPGAIATLEAMVRRGIADQRLMIVLADYLAASGALPKALGLLDAVIAAHPDEVEAHNSLGVVAMRMGQHDRARQAFKKVLELDPTSATAYANLGADALSSGDLQGAVGDLSRSLELDPRQLTVLYNRAMALDALGRRDEARRDMERFIAQAPPARYAREIVEFKKLLGR